MKSPIANYGLIVETNPAELVASVTKVLEDGYQPLGGVSICRESRTPQAPLGCTRYAQAVIKIRTHEELGVLAFSSGRG